MKLGLAILIACLSVACASSRALVPLDLPGIPREVDPSLSIMTANGQAGHGCPVEGVVYTARHVMWNRELNQFEGATWSAYAGPGRIFEGAAVVEGVSPVSDVVQLMIAGGPPKYLPRGIAKDGELVFWFEYDFRTKVNALRARRRFARVLRQVARQYVLDEIPSGGASGSCLINERGEAVGTITGGWELLDKTYVGVAPKLPLREGESF